MCEVADEECERFGAMPIAARFEQILRSAPMSKREHKYGYVLHPAVRLDASAVAVADGGSSQIRLAQLRRVRRNGVRH